LSIQRVAAESIPVKLADDRRAIAAWLLVLAAMVFAIVVIGGLTRLTESGLSIVEWQPIRGVLPPFSEADWQALFDKYRQSPQFRQSFPDLTLAGFREIFWLEYVHRLWGRLIGLVFLVPFVWFWARRRIPSGLMPRLLGLFVLGGLQGALGWAMVASGLVDRPSVSHYRLAAHLGLAILIYVALLWTALGLLQGRGAVRPEDGFRRRYLVVLILVALTILYGAFVAGLRAGWIHNTFPLMGGALVPDSYWARGLGLANLVENHDAVQFNHRALATLTLLAATWLWLGARRRPKPLRAAVTLVLAAVAAQYALGVATILIFGVSRPPLAGGVAIGTVHQAGAMLVVTAAVWLAHAARRAAPAAATSAR
jgi:cytochrome c oxidase assembly protein subunit 15